jgi:hypothetical protein
MKHVLVLFYFLAAFAVSGVQAQSSCKPADCKPCPPGCCIINCCSKSSAAASTFPANETDVAFAAIIAEGLKSCERPAGISRKEWKACLSACKETTQAQSTAHCQPSPSCKPAVVPGTTATPAATVHHASLQVRN